MEIGNLVVVKETGQCGHVRLLEGVGYAKVYVELLGGPDPKCIYIRMRVSTGIETLFLNTYDINQVELVEG